MRALVAIAALAVAGCTQPGSLSSCSVDQYVTLDTAGDVVDCGNFSRGQVNYTDDAMVAAQRCVLNAIVRKQSFRLLYDPGTPSGAVVEGLRAGWTGIVEGDRMRLQMYAGEQKTDMSSSENPFVSSRACDMVDATAGCKPAVGVPCLDCQSTTPPQVSCRG